MTQFKSSHNLPFLSKHWDHFSNTDDWQEFLIGTCHGQWISTPTSYDILTVINEEPGNGHFTDVLEWFEQSCKRDGKALRILEVWNKKLAKHLITKRGFIEQPGYDLIKHFTPSKIAPFKKYIEDYLNGDNYTQIVCPDLLKEMERFTRKGHMEEKVCRVIALCLKQGHDKLVERIEKKYSHYLPKYDFVMALQLSLMAEQRSRAMTDILPQIPKTP